MPIDSEVVMMRRAHCHDPHRLAAKGVDRQMIEQVLQCTRKRAAIDGTREHDDVGVTHASHDRSGIVTELVRRPTVGKRDAVVGQIYQIRFEIRIDGL